MCKHTMWLVQSSCLFPSCTAENHWLSQRTAVIAQRWREKNGVGEQSLIYFVTFQVLLCSFPSAFIWLSPTSHGLDPCNVFFPQQSITCRLVNFYLQVKIQGAAHWQVIHSHWVFSALPWEHFWEVFLTPSHPKVLCLSGRFRQGLSGNIFMWKKNCTTANNKHFFKS